MLTHAIVKGRKFPLVLFIGSLFLLLTACDSNDAASPDAAATNAVVTSANMTIRHTPTGTVQMSWDHISHILTVQVALTGLTPKSVHPAHVATGSCRNPGKEAYTLKDVESDAIGFANAITRLPDVNDGIPVNGWYVTVNNGPDASSDVQSRAIACGDITNSSTSASSAQSAQATLTNTTDPNQSASGNVGLSINDKQLNVVLTVQGLVPHEKYDAAIHTGSCASQGKLIYALKSFSADATGKATTTTKFPNVSSLPRSGWYVSIQEVVESKKPAPADLVACGDMVPLRS